MLRPHAGPARMRVLPALELCAIVLFALTLFVAVPAGAQPSSDIFLAELSVRDGVARVGPPVNVTVRPGYDDQPHFTADGSSLLYSSVIDNGQADIFRYDIAARTATQLTRTAESEFSPVPLSDGGFAVVRVGADSVRRLWRFDADGRNATLLLDDVAPVGYFAFGSDQDVALFVAGAPPRLVLAGLHGGERRTVAEDIGRSLQRVPGRRAVTFTQRIEDERVVLVELDVAASRLRVVAEARPGGDHHAWTPQGILLMSHGSRLYQWGGARDRRWREVLDLGARGVEITRITVSPTGDRIALVGQPRQQP